MVDGKTEEVADLLLKYRDLETELRGRYQKANNVTAPHQQVLDLSTFTINSLRSIKDYILSDNRESNPKNEENKMDDSMNLKEILLSRPSQTPGVREVSEDRQRLPLLQEYIQNQKRKALFGSLRDTKRPRSNSQQKRPVSGYPNLQQDQLPLDVLDSPQERLTTYAEVRRLAEKDGHWDFIVEFPQGSSSWYVLYCQDHGVHFKQNAIAAAAKHLNGLAHGFPDRTQEPAIQHLGYRITDCTRQLQDAHNNDVKNAYHNGYEPENKLKNGNQGNKVEYPFKKKSEQPKKENESKKADDPMKAKKRAAFKVEYTNTQRPPQPSARNPKSSQQSHQPNRSIITHPKTFHIYYTAYVEEVQGDDIPSYWPVIILSWDDFRPGKIPGDTSVNNISPNALSETSLLDKVNDPPECYVYDKDRISGWAPGYEDDGDPAKIKKRQFPVMFFDENRSCGWAPAEDLSRFGIEKKGPPKKRGYPVRPFHEARKFIARREGYADWHAREEARRNGTLVRWKPGHERPSITEGLFSRTTGLTQATEDKSGLLEPAYVDEELKFPNRRADKLPGDGNYEVEEEEEDDDIADNDIDIGIKAVTPSQNPGSGWSSRSDLQSDDKSRKTMKNHHRIRQPYQVPMESSETMAAAGAALDSQPSSIPSATNASEQRASSIPVAVSATSQKFTAKRTNHHQSRATLLSRSEIPIATAPLTIDLPKASLPPRPPVALPTVSSSEWPRLHSNARPSETVTTPLTTKSSVISLPPQTFTLTKTPQISDSLARPIPSETPGGRLEVIRGPNQITLPTSINNVQKQHRFEIGEYHSNSRQWERPSPIQDGIQLFEQDDGKVLRSRAGAPVDVSVDASEWGALNTKSIKGNCIITITRKDGKWIQMKFERREGDNRISSGRQQAREFIRWLRGERHKLGQKLDATYG